MRNVILTGIPRSGTTLAAALIDGLPGAVCLNEPQWQVRARFPHPNDYARWLVGDFTELRRKLLAGEPVEERRSLEEQTPLTNYFSVDPESRQMQTHYRLVEFTRPGLTPDFLLGVKHNGPYLAVLKALVDTGAFTVVAILRHPLEVIHSWRSLSLPISRGEMPGATPYWPDLARLVASPIDLLEKQVRMYDLMAHRLYNLRERIHILPYEQLTETPMLLAKYLEVEAVPAAQLVDKPTRRIPEEEREKIAAALRAHGEYARHFYPDIAA